MQQLWGKSEKNARGTTLQTLRSVKKQGDEFLQALEQMFPCSLWWTTSEQPCSLWRARHQTGLLAGTAACGEIAYEGAGFSGRICGQWVTHARAVCSLRTVPCGKGPMLEQFCEGLNPVWGTTHSGAGAECEEELAAEMKCFELTATPYSPSACTSCGGRRYKNHEWNWAWEGWRGNVFLVLSLFFAILHYFYLQEINFPHVRACFAPDNNW